MVREHKPSLCDADVKESNSFQLLEVLIEMVFKICGVELLNQRPPIILILITLLRVRL
jgi:hypothetical protein